MSDFAETIRIERDGLAEVLEAVAAAREILTLSGHRDAICGRLLRPKADIRF